MISDPTLFVECDRCDERVDFTFSLVLDDPNWQISDLFKGWEIDWAGTSGAARCPKHKDEE